MTSWRPSADVAALRIRADLLARTRAFFADRDVLEVETPALSRAAATDRRIESLRTRVAGDGARYLHTSPEFPMKRLLAAHRIDVYQICKVYRDGEAGRLHTPEFTLLEWYRVGFNHHQLMDEVSELLTNLLAQYRPLATAERWTYRDAFVEYARVDPFADSCARLERAVRDAGVIPPRDLGDDRSAWLDLLLSCAVAPRLGRGRVSFVYDFPEAAAALARLRPGKVPVAERFEAFIAGIELANGFHELTDAAEQRARFVADLDARAHSGASAVPIDEHLLAALTEGLPDCAGVALGFDRVAMLATGSRDIRGVLSFPFETA
ncbi:elongation factor P--(R)-beta-lysine ligase [soil metagenome]